MPEHKLWPYLQDNGVIRRLNHEAGTHQRSDASPNLARSANLPDVIAETKKPRTVKCGAFLSLNLEMVNMWTWFEINAYISIW